MTEIIINADDFGISKGVNAAVIAMYKSGNLTSASIMICAKHADAAINVALQNPGLEVGLHFNLTTGKSAAKNNSIPLLTNKNNIFRYGFLWLLLLSVFKRRQFQKEVELELKSQLSLLKTAGIKPSHIDSHRHIHYIPEVFKIVNNIAQKENIPRVRIINESLLDTLLLKKLPPVSGLVKWSVLKSLSLFHGKVKNSTYFFSIIYSCRISNSLLQKFRLKRKYKAIEIMLHPSFIPSEAKEEEYEKKHLLSRYRTIESKFIKPKL